MILQWQKSGRTTTDCHVRPPWGLTHTDGHSSRSHFGWFFGPLNPHRTSPQGIFIATVSGLFCSHPCPFFETFSRPLTYISHSPTFGYLPAVVECKRKDAIACSWRNLAWRWNLHSALTETAKYNLREVKSQGPRPRLPNACTTNSPVSSDDYGRQGAANESPQNVFI